MTRTLPRALRLPSSATAALAAWLAWGSLPARVVGCVLRRAGRALAWARRELAGDREGRQ